MPTLIQIRPVLESDQPFIFDFVNSLENTSFNQQKFGLAFKELIADPLNIYFMAESEGNPVGYISCHTQRLLHHGGEMVAEIQELFVNTTHRKLGVGKMLLDHLIGILISRNVFQLELATNVARYPAHVFYEHQGFTHTHRKYTIRLDPFHLALPLPSSEGSPS